MENLHKIWFVALPISSKVKIELIKQLNSYEDIYINRNLLFKKLNVYKKILAINLNNDKIKKIEESLKRKEYFMLLYTDENYPKMFKEIDDPPFCVFCKGDVKKLNELNFIAIVGSRKHSAYGEHITKEIVSNLKGQDKIGLVSGGAIGIDSVGHVAAIENSVFNVAILGCGIDVVYPKSNISLFKKILDNGVILTEFLPGESPIYYNFPRRNRLISSLSKAVIVVEANEKSGATNTAYHGNLQNKYVYAVPGNINSEYSRGCNMLIKDGALLYLDIESVFKDIGAVYKSGQNDINYQIKLKIFSILGDKPIHFDEIVNEIKVDRNIINELLFEMQFNNDVIGLTGNNYMKILRNN
ncbi:MAG: DNA-processing protein DprA [Sarcina sp.]